MDVHDERAIHLGVEQTQKFALDGLALGDSDVTPEDGFLDGQKPDVL